MPRTERKPEGWRWRVHSHFSNSMREHPGWYLLPTIITHPLWFHSNRKRMGHGRYSLWFAFRWLAWEWTVLVSRTRYGISLGGRSVTGKIEEHAIEYANPSEIEKTINNELVTIDDSILLLWNSAEHDVSGENPTADAGR